MKRFIPILAVIVLIVALVFVNKSISKTARPDNDDDDSSQSSSQTKPSTPPSTPTGGPDTGDALSPEMMLGNPAQAQYKITVGWIYDESNQTNPAALAAALKVIQDAAAHSGGKISAEIVDLDVPASDLSPAASAVTGLGVMVNGKPVGPAGNPGEGMLVAGFLAHELPRP